MTNTGEAVRLSTRSHDHGYDVCGAQAAGNWVEGRGVTLLALHWPPEGVQLCRPHPFCGRYSLTSEYHRR